MSSAPTPSTAASAKRGNLPEVLPLATPLEGEGAEAQRLRCQSAAQILEKAAHGGHPDPNVLYLLALAYKRQGKINEARTALRKIPRPDANILLQMALLSLAEQNLFQAEEELQKAWEMDSTSYEICFNLLLTQLTLGKVPECSTLIPRAIELVGQRPTSKVPGQGTGEEKEEDARFLTVLQVLLKACQKGSGSFPDPVLADLSANDEQRLLKVIRSLGQLDTVHTLLKALAAARPNSQSVREAYVEAVLVKGKELVDRCNWTEAELLLRPLSNQRGFSRPSQVALLNLLGCCACATQDFDGAVRNFSGALKLSPNDARIHQNLALTYELQGDLAQADPHWNRFFDLVGNQVPAPEDIPRYLEQLTYESLTRLAGRYSEREKWASAVGYVQRACSVRPNDPDTMERLFHLYTQAKRHQDARRTLEQLRKIRPGEPQYDLYELDLIEVKGLNDIEKLLNEITRIRSRHPGETRVEERAVQMVNNVIPLIGNLCDQLTDQLSKVVDQVRHLPNYQINWAAVREVMRDLLREFQKLRRIAGKCQTLVTSDEPKRMIRDLLDHIDKKMEACRSMGA